MGCVVTRVLEQDGGERPAWQITRFLTRRWRHPLPQGEREWMGIALLIGDARTVSFKGVAGRVPYQARASRYMVFENGADERSAVQRGVGRSAVQRAWGAAGAAGWRPYRYR